MRMDTNHEYQLISGVNDILTRFNKHGEMAFALREHGNGTSHSVEVDVLVDGDSPLTLALNSSHCSITLGRERLRYASPSRATAAFIDVYERRRNKPGSNPF